MIIRMGKWILASVVFLLLSFGSIGISPDFQAGGWQANPELPGTMVCSTPGGIVWIVETGGEARPASGAALNTAGLRRLYDLSVRIEDGGRDGLEQEFAYAPVLERAEEGRTPRELAFPFVRRSGLGIQRRLWIQDDGAARWTDLFVNEADVEIVFEAVLANEKQAGDAPGSPGRMDSLGAWNVFGGPQEESFLALVHKESGPSKGAFFFGDERSTADSSGIRAWRPYWAYQIRLAPGETAVVLNYAVPASGLRAAAAVARRLSSDPTGRMAWMSPREKRSLWNFGLPETAVSAPGIVLGTPLTALCWGITPVRVEVESDPAVVRMELTYWEDWDLPQGHSYYEHPLATDLTRGRGLRYDICWDVPNSPRHSGGFWKLEGTAWNASGESASFLTNPFTLAGSCTEACTASTVILAPALVVPVLHASAWRSAHAKFALLECEASNPDGVPFIEFVLLRRSANSDFRVVRRFAAAILLAGKQWTVDGPLSKSGEFVYRLEARNAAGESVGRSADVTI